MVLSKLEQDILNLYQGENKEERDENSNKDARARAVKRNLAAGIVNRHFANLMLPEHIIQAHNNGRIHFHDNDFFLSRIVNCMLINLKDMLDNGTVLNDVLIEKPKSLLVAATVATQIIMSVADNCYGGKTIYLSDLSEYAQISRDKYKKWILDNGIVTTEQEAEHYADVRTDKEIQDAIQVIFYQLNTMMANGDGQIPFLTIGLQLNPQDKYYKRTKKLINELFRQRIVGIKNSKGVATTQAFPKLVTIIDENWRNEDIDTLNLALQCCVNRIYPDIISAKMMKEQYSGEQFCCMGCRNFLPLRKDGEGNYKRKGRFNNGVVSLNLPSIAKEGKEKFWDTLLERLQIVREGLYWRYEYLKTNKAKDMPILFQHGAIARLNPEDSIEPLLKGGYSTFGVGYIGLAECVELLGVKYHSPEGKQLGLEILESINKYLTLWTEADGIKYSLYGTPAENTAGRFAKIDGRDRKYYTNSYHIPVREEINAFEKIDFEKDFQRISQGGFISYVEVPRLDKNIKALEELWRYMYDNIIYCEVNFRDGYCYSCGYKGDMNIGDDLVRTCPECGENNRENLSVVARTTGYLGSKFWGEARTKEIRERFLHLK